MSNNSHSILLCALLLLPLAFPYTVTAYETAPNTKQEEKKTDVVVEGKVYCQSCEHYGTWSLSGAEPIPRAKVSVICKNHLRHVSYYKAFEADEQGYFYAQLDGFKMSNNLLDHPLQACHVKLVSSSITNCSVLSNVNYGMYGTPLRYGNKILRGKTYEAVVYAAGPLAFLPVECPTHP